MALILALGSNIGDRELNLKNAISALNIVFGTPTSLSKIYSSEPFGEIKQEDFLNMCIEYPLPSFTAQESLKHCLTIEKDLGRERKLHWGPRIIDIDIIFYGNEQISEQNLTIPHPHINERSFVVLPLKDLPYYQQISKTFKFSQQFSTESFVYKTSLLLQK